MLPLFREASAAFLNLALSASLRSIAGVEGVGGRGGVEVRPVGEGDGVDDIRERKEGGEGRGESWKDCRVAEVGGEGEDRAVVNEVEEAARERNRLE